jgi:hypothetical protein
MNAAPGQAAPGSARWRHRRGAWGESASAFQTREDADIHSDLSAGLLIDTVIGALLASGSVGDDGSTAFYVALGRPFW